MTWLPFISGRLAIPAGALSLLVIGSPPAAADVNMGGETIEIDDSAPDCGLSLGVGWTLGVDAAGDYTCECTDAFFCGGGDMLDDGPGGGGPGGGGGAGGGGSPGDDDEDCADPDTPCNCEQEDPEPGFCELNCLECENQDAVCMDSAKEDLASCRDRNLEIAEGVCSLEELTGPELEACVAQELWGTPGQGTTTSHGSRSGWDVSGSGGIGIGKWTLGGSIGKTGSTSQSSSSSESYPFVPADSVYRDCKSESRDAVVDCKDSKNECMSNSSEAGESCDES